jgi:hypothetical protein
VEIKAYVNGCEVMANGVVHVAGDNFRMTLDGLAINVFFLDDNKGSRWETSSSGDSMELKLYNLNGVLPEGRIEPITIASADQGEILMTFLVSTIDQSKGLRAFQYTLLLNGNAHG